MNEHILQKLMNKSYVDINKYNNRFSPEKFAELIVKECGKVYIQNQQDGVMTLTQDLLQHFGVEE